MECAWKMTEVETKIWQVYSVAGKGSNRNWFTPLVLGVVSKKLYTHRFLDATLILHVLTNRRCRNFSWIPTCIGYRGTRPEPLDPSIGLGWGQRGVQNLLHAQEAGRIQAVHQVWGCESLGNSFHCPSFSSKLWRLPPLRLRAGPENCHSWEPLWLQHRYPGYYFRVPFPWSMLS